MKGSNPLGTSNNKDYRRRWSFFIYGGCAELALFNGCSLLQWFLSADAHGLVLHAGNPLGHFYLIFVRDNTLKCWATS